MSEELEDEDGGAGLVEEDLDGDDEGGEGSEEEDGAEEDA
jgi:hypothetical protein